MGNGRLSTCRLGAMMLFFFKYEEGREKDERIAKTQRGRHPEVAIQHFFSYLYTFAYVNPEVPSGPYEQATNVGDSLNH